MRRAGRVIDDHAQVGVRLIEELREQLRRAESGEYRSVHICAFRTDGEMVRVSAGGWVTFEVIAALECAKHGIISNNIKPDS